MVEAGAAAAEPPCSPPEVTCSNVPLLENDDRSIVRQRSMHLKGYVAHDLDGSATALTHCTSTIKLQVNGQLSASLVLKTLFYVLAWYTLSICLTLYNKMLLGDDLGKFPAPLLMNAVHFFLQALLSNVIVWWREERVTMSWRDYLSRVVPTALGTAVDVNLSNLSLVFISVTFATMCKSSSLVFLLAFAFAFRLESPSIELLGIILIISLGVLLTVAKETEFELWGFILVILSSVASGFRWSMTQILLQKETYGLKNPLTFMCHIAPVMTILTAGLSLALDPWKEFHQNVYFDDRWHAMRSLLLMLTGGTLAFLMVFTEYLLVSETSAVTGMIAGAMKEAVTIIVAVLYFHEHFTFLKGIGLMIIIIGVGMFNFYKYKKLQKASGNNSGEVTLTNLDGSAKYVILEEINSKEEGI